MFVAGVVIADATACRPKADEVLVLGQLVEANHRRRLQPLAVDRQKYFACDLHGWSLKNELHGRCEHAELVHHVRRDDGVQAVGISTGILK